jgi:Domain of unknown function (DUF4259)
MGTWDSGPFDNDAAADWCAELTAADPAQRVPVIRRALTEVIDEDGYLDYDLAAQAVAAAAVVATGRPGGPPVDSPGMPEFLAAGTGPPLPEDLAPLASRAVDRVLSDDSEWRQLWAGNAGALAGLQSIREALQGR